ncbi:LOW QUALITY PROTEIN: StAR-related lipid transfer protein 9, partial [Galemys pyrenaicus]
APPGRSAARAWAGRSRESRGAGGAGLGLVLGLGRGLGMLQLGPLTRLGRRPEDGERAGGSESSAPEQEVNSRLDSFGDSREKIMAFGFDYCYWSVNPEDPHYASQDVVFQDLGTEVLSGAAKGYNICLFAYGQTGSGKTYTMLGTPVSIRLDFALSLPVRDGSFLEIYNERVRDLLKQSDPKRSYTLRVREHPEMGPYVQGLSQHVVTNYNQVIQLLEEGIANRIQDPSTTFALMVLSCMHRITAATHVHEASSRSHAIFTIHYTQAILENNLPSEIASKINLVDLAGSERADPSYCKDRITEGANINKSLVTLGIVISTLAQNSQVFSSCQSLNSTASDGGDSGVPSSSGTSGGGGPSRRQSYIPYRDSVLTWLLKDSLGGNSKTFMVATVSPAHTSYSETMSTLRYASNAKNIINKPRVNEDANVKLIRELRDEIRRLKAILLSFELRSFSPLNEEKDENLKELVLQNELKIDQLTKDWTRKWDEWKALLEQYRVDINRRRAGVVIDSSLPHLMALEDDVLSTGVVLYHLKNLVSVKLHLRTKKEGTTKIGRIDSDQEQDIVLQGQWIERDHCTITSACGVVVLQPAQGARCTVNGREVTASCRLTQASCMQYVLKCKQFPDSCLWATGAVITLGKAQKFRFNHPAEAAVLRERRQAGEAVRGSGSLEWLDLDRDGATGQLCLCPSLWKERRVLEEQDEGHRLPGAGGPPPGAQLQQQQCSVGELRQRVLAGQIRAKQDLESDQAHASQPIPDASACFTFLSSCVRSPSLLCSRLCFLCDMMESLALGILSPLLETRDSYMGLEARIRRLPSLLAPRAMLGLPLAPARTRSSHALAPAAVHSCVEAWDIIPWPRDQQWLLREETRSASLQWQQQQHRVAKKALEASRPTDAWPPTGPETQPSPPFRSQKRALQPPFLRRHALRAAARKVQRRKISSKLERIIKRQRLLEAQKRLEQLQALCWLRDDQAQGPPHQAPGPDCVGPEPQCSSESTSCSSLSLRRLCSQYWHQLHRYSQQFVRPGSTWLSSGALSPSRCSLFPSAASSVCEMEIPWLSPCVHLQLSKPQIRPSPHTLHGHLDLPPQVSFPPPLPSCFSLTLQTGRDSNIGLGFNILKSKLVYLNWNSSTTSPPMPFPTRQASGKISSEEHLPQDAFYPPRAGRFSENALCSSDKEQLCVVRGALGREGPSPVVTWLTESSEMTSILEMERAGKQPRQVVSQSSAFLNQSTNKLKARNEPEPLTPSSQTRRTRGLTDSGHVPAGWQKGGYLGTHRTAKGTGCGPSHLPGPRQTAGRGRPARTACANSKPPSLSRASKRQPTVQAARVRDIAKKSSRLPHGIPLRRRHSAKEPDITSSLVDFSPGVGHVREKDGDLSSDADSSYSADSLSCVCAKELTEPLKPGDPQGKQQEELPETENTESDDSQISEDSLAEKGYRSPHDSARSSYCPNTQGHPRTRARASLRDFLTSSESGPVFQTHRSFSLDSLIDAEEDLGDQQEDSVFGPSDEMPTETFWRLQTPSLPVVGQAMYRCGPVGHRAGAKLEDTPPRSSSFYLEPRSCSEQPELGAEENSEQAGGLQAMQLARGSPLVSMDSWFSCDSKINPSSPPEIVDSLCPSPAVQEFQHSGWERPGYWLNAEELKPSGAEAVPPPGSKHPQGGAELPRCVGEAYTMPASDRSLCQSHKLQPEVGGTFQARGICDMAQRGTSEASNSSSVLSVLAASATSFAHVGRAHERDWAVLQQKYLLELSHPVLGAKGEPRPAFSSLEEDSSSLTQASSKGEDTLLPGITKSPDLKSPIRLSKIRRLRAEKEQDSLSVELESTTDFFTTSEREVSYCGNYSADVESMASGATSAHFVAEKRANPVTEACEVQKNLEESSQGSRKPEPMATSNEYSSLKNSGCGNVVAAAEDGPGPQGWAPLGKKNADQPGPLSHSSHQPVKEEKGDYQESSREVAGGQADVALGFPSGPELRLHSAFWSPLPSSLQAPPLETFYVTKSRDALTETALEIPACRDARVPSPPPREAWGFGHDFRLLENAYWKKNFPVLLQSQNPRRTTSQQVTAEGPVDPNAKEVSREIGKCSGDVKEESRNSFYFFVAQNRQDIPQVRILNEHSLPAFKEEENGSISAETRKPLFPCESETREEEEQDPDALLRHSRAFDMNKPFPSGTRSDFISQFANAGPDKRGERAVSLKPRSVHRRVSSPETVAQEERPTHKGEGQSETGLLRKALHPSGGSEEFTPPGTEAACERFLTVACSQERNPSESKGPRKSQETSSPKEEPSRMKQNERVNNDNEMARLIKSVMQLENDILEIESKQNKQLCASHISRARKEMADLVLIPGSSGNHVSFKDQLSSPRQTDDIPFRASDAGEMEGNCSVEDSLVQKITPSSIKSRVCGDEAASVGEHTQPAVLDGPAGDYGDHVGTACRDFSGTSLKLRRKKALAQAPPAQPWPERSAEKEDELPDASASPRGQPYGLGSPEELEMADFWESQAAERIIRSEQKDPTVQGRVEMTVQRGGSPREESSVVLSTQNLGSQSQHGLGTPFSLESDSSPSRLDPPVTPPHPDMSSTSPLGSPRLPRSYRYAPDNIGISSVDCMLDPRVSKILYSPLVTGAERQDRSGELGSHGPWGDVSSGSSVAQSACGESAVSTAVGSHGQSSVPESPPWGSEDWTSASFSSEAQGANLRGSSVGLESAPEAEGAAQRETQKTSSLSRVFSQLAARASCPSGEGNRGREVPRKAEEAEDFSPTSSALSAPVSLPSVPNPELSAYHTHTGPAVLETRQAEAQEKQLQDSVAGGPVLPYYETLLEPECSSEAPGRPHSPQVNRSLSRRTWSEGDAEGFHGTLLPSEPGSLSTDDREVLRATPLSAEGFQPLPHTEAVTVHWHPSRASSHAVPAPGQRHRTGELRHLLGASEQSTCHCSSSETEEENKAAARTPSPAGALGSGHFPSATAAEEDRRVIPEKEAAGVSSQAPSDGPVAIPRGHSPLALWQTTESSSSQESRPAHQAPRILETTYRRSVLGNFLVAQRGKTTYFESPVVIHDEDSASLSGPTQDQVQCLEASATLEEEKTSPPQDTALPGALKRMEPEAPSPPSVKWKGSVGSGLAEACRAGSKHPFFSRSTPLLDQGRSPNPGGVKEDAPYRCLEETLDCVACSGDSEGSRALSPPRGQEDGRTLPCQQPGSPQPTASHACPSPPSTLLCRRESDPEKGVSKAAPHTSHSSRVIPPGACGLDERTESYSREPGIFLPRGLEPKGPSVGSGPADSSILESSAKGAFHSQGQGCSSFFPPGVKTSSLCHSVAAGSSRSGGGPEKKVSEMNVSTKLEAAPFPAGRSLEQLEKFQGSSLGGQNIQLSQPEPEPPAATGKPHTLSSSEKSLVHESVAEPYYGCLENALKYLLEKPQLYTKSRGLSDLEPQTKSAEQLKYIPGPQADSPWEEEEQQRDQASTDDTQDGSPPPPDEGDTDGFSSSQSRDVGGGKAATAKAPVPQTSSSGVRDLASVPLKQSMGSQAAPQSLGQPPGRAHRQSLPVIAISANPKYLKSLPRPQFSVVSSSRSLQELNLSVEPPSPTDEEEHEPERLWPPRTKGCCSGKAAVRASVEAEGRELDTASDVSSSAADHRPLQPASPPYPTSSTLSCMPTPDFMTPISLEQVQQGKPETLGGQTRPEKPRSKVEKGMLHFGSSDINPYVLHRRPEEPARIGWKQFVFGSAVDVSCSQMPQGPIPSKVARCSSVDQGLGEQSSPFQSHLSTYAHARGLSSTYSSIDNAQASQESWGVWGSSLALGSPCALAGPRRAAPTKGPDKRAQFLSPPNGADSLGSEHPLAEESAAGPVDEIVLLYPSEAGSPMAPARIDTLEQGTQTLGCRLRWSYSDVSALLEAGEVPASDLASWASMRNLSVHLSQLLHSTSELLGSLSQPSVTRKEPNTQRETPDEAPPTLMMDGCTQTTMDEGVQTNVAPPPLRLLTPEASPQQVNVILKVLASDVSSPSWQEKEHVPETLQKTEAEGTVWKMAGPPDLQKASPCCTSQSPPVSVSHLRFQNISSASPQASPDASLPPSSQPEDSSHLAVHSPHSRSPGSCPSNVESTREPQVQKEPGPMTALLVDRASSPILTLSASAQATELSPSSLSLSPPSAHALEGFQKLVSNPDLPHYAPSPPVDDSYQTTDESGGSQKVEALHGEGRSPLGRSVSRPFLEASSSDSLEQSPKLQVRFLDQLPQQLQSRKAARVQSRPPPLPPRSRSRRLADGFVPEDVALPGQGQLDSRGPSRWPDQAEDESEPSPVEPPHTLDLSSSWGGPQHPSPCAASELTDTLGLQGSALDAAQGPSEGLLRCGSGVGLGPEPQHHGLRDLPVHNKFSDWCGVQDDSPGRLNVQELLGTRCHLNSGGQEGPRLPQPPDSQGLDLEWARGETIPLQVGAQNSLSTELTEARLHRGFGEADALLQVLQSETGETGEAFAAEAPALSTWEERSARTPSPEQGRFGRAEGKENLRSSGIFRASEIDPKTEEAFGSSSSVARAFYLRQKQAIEALRRERAERLQNFRRTRSLSPQKRLSPLPDPELPIRELDLPSRRREYLKQLRKDVVETTRSPGSASRSSHLPSDIELMLQDYQRAREEAKVEIAQARARLRERTEQEKLRIRQQIVSQLLREEEKLHTLAASSSVCASSNASLSSGVTSGYNSSPALPSQLPSPDNVGDTNLPNSRDTWIGDVRGHAAVRPNHLSLTGSVWKSLAYSSRASLGSCCCSPSSLSSLGTSYSSCYQDLAKHIVDISMADVMAACSDNLHNLFSRQAAAGWNYQGEEQEVQLYYKVFSSTRHGFLGAGIVSQPLAHVWAAVSDPTLWPLYHKPIQTARLHQRVTNSINLVYLVCNTALCALKQPRDFCCVCVEAKEGHLSIMAAQSVYDTSMPRPSREMVRGEILPSAWILQPLTVEGKELTRVIYLAQVELGAPGFPHQLLSSFIKQQPLIIAKLASFLASRHQEGSVEMQTQDAPERCWGSHLLPSVRCAGSARVTCNGSWPGSTQPSLVSARPWRPPLWSKGPEPSRVNEAQLAFLISHLYFLSLGPSGSKPTRTGHSGETAARRYRASSKLSLAGGKRAATGKPLLRTCPSISSSVGWSVRKDRTENS